MGRLTTSFSIAEPYVGIGGLLIVCTRPGGCGLMADEDFVVGSGGGALLPKVADVEEVAFAAFC